MLAVLDEQQQQLRDTLARAAPPLGIRNPTELGTVDTTGGWRRLADLGMLSLRVRDGGTPTASGVECMLAAEALGAVLSPLPLAGNLVATELLCAAGAPDAWIDDLACGRVRYGVLVDSQLAAPTDGRTDTVVWDGDGASHVLAWRATGDGRTLVRLPVGGAAPTASADLSRSLLRWSSASGDGEPVGMLTTGAVARAMALALVLVCADTVGVMRAALDGAVAYARERVQYGKPIGSFQAVQHLCAEAQTRLTGALAATDYAAWCVDGVAPDDALGAARVAKVACALAGREVTEIAMQVYGGIGQTFEHVAHLHTRRALLNEMLLGDPAHHLDHIANRVLLGAAS